MHIVPLFWHGSTFSEVTISIKVTLLSEEWCHQPKFIQIQPFFSTVKIVSMVCAKKFIVLVVAWFSFCFTLLQK